MIRSLFCSTLQKTTDIELTLPSVYPGWLAGAAVVLTRWFTVHIVRLGQCILDHEVLTGGCGMPRL